MKNKKYLYDIKLELSDSDFPTCVITNRKTEQYGCVIHKDDLNEIRNWKQYKDTDFYFDLRWIPNYMIKEAIEKIKSHIEKNYEHLQKHR